MTQASNGIAIPYQNLPCQEESGPSPSYLDLFWRRLRKKPLGVLGMLLLALIVLSALLVPAFSQFQYYEIDLASKNLPPGWQHWFGTDDLGRDIFIRVWMGARISLAIGIAAAFIDMAIGMLWGGIAALAGGIADDLMMRIADILYAIPYVLVVILLAILLGSGFTSILIAMTVIGWITMARIVRGKILQLKQEQYVQAARVLGAGFFRILFVHLLPNAMGPIIVTLTFTVPSAIFTEAFLSFFGLGVQAPMASWGTMANEGLPAMLYYPWRLFFPALLICATMLSFNLIGDAIHSALTIRN